MATKRTFTDSRDLSEGRENLKSSNTGSRRATRDLFSPRRLIGRNDMVVDLNLGKVVIPKEEGAGVIKEEKISEELEHVTDRTSAVEDQEGDIQVKLVGEDVVILDNFEEATLLTCSCACWNKVESLEAIVAEQGRQIQNLNNVVMGLLGKQVASEQVQRPSGKKGLVHPVLSESQPTQADGIESGEETGAGANPANESLLHAVIPAIGILQSKKESGASSANARKGSSRPLPPVPSHPNGTGNSSKPARDGISTKVKKRVKEGASGEKHACPHCAKEGRHRFCSTYRSLKRHVQEKHSLQKKLHKCNTCSKTFIRKWLLDQHIKSTHDGVRYQCTHCTGSYAFRHNLIQHEKIHARGIPLIRCKHCGLDLISDESLKRHVGRWHGSGKVSGKKRPKRPDAPPTHKKVYVGRKTRDCPLCDKRFDCDASLRYHLHKKHGILQTGYNDSLSDGVKGRSSQD